MNNLTLAIVNEGEIYPFLSKLIYNIHKDQAPKTQLMVNCDILSLLHIVTKKARQMSYQFAESQILYDANLIFETCLELLDYYKD